MFLLDVVFLVRSRVLGGSRGLRRDRFGNLGRRGMDSLRDVGRFGRLSSHLRLRWWAGHLLPYLGLRGVTIGGFSFLIAETAEIISSSARGGAAKMQEIRT